MPRKQLSHRMFGVALHYDTVSPVTVAQRAIGQFKLNQQLRGTVLPRSFSHFDNRGNATMVDVSKKPSTFRVAVACGSIRMLPATYRRIRAGKTEKGDVLGIARIAAIQATKRTSDLIPLCHPLRINHAGVEFQFDKQQSSIKLIATVSSTGATGVEMEALIAVSIGLLTVYDMCKSVDRAMRIKSIMLVEKSGGKSGNFKHPRSK